MKEEPKQNKKPDDLALKLAIIGGGTGILSGMVEIISGSRLSFLTGHEEGTLALGLLTILISGFSAYSAYRSKNESILDIDKRAGWLLGISLPGVIGFILAGALWLIPAIMFFISTGIMFFDLKKEFRNEGRDIFISIPKWKRILSVIGAFLVLTPIIFGAFVKGAEISSFEDEDAEYFIRPMTWVERQGEDGDDSRSNVIGILLVHMVLLICSIICLLSTQLGAKTIVVGSGVFIVLSLIFLFVFIPNIMFVEGARMVQFDGNHFSSLSGGWYAAMTGGLLIIVMQFIKMKC